MQAKVLWAIVTILLLARIQLNIDTSALFALLRHLSYIPIQTTFVIHKPYMMCYMVANYPLKKRGRGNCHALSKCIVQAENISCQCFPCYKMCYCTRLLNSA
jgi:hypothetical protein